MIVTIGDRVKVAIDHMEKGELGLALNHICTAVDITSQKVFDKTRSSKSDYKKFLSDYMWLITYMGFPGIIANGVRFKFSHPDVELDSDGYCRIEDIVYHVIRCGLVHSTRENSKIIWEEKTRVGTEDGNLVIPKSIIWGLIGAVVFCPVNKDEIIGKTYWLNIEDFKYFIQEMWGRIDIPKRIIKVKTGTLMY